MVVLIEILYFVSWSAFWSWQRESVPRCMIRIPTYVLLFVVMLSDAWLKPLIYILHVCCHTFKVISIVQEFSLVQDDNSIDIQTIQDTLRVSGLCTSVPKLAFQVHKGLKFNICFLKIWNATISRRIRWWPGLSLLHLLRVIWQLQYHPSSQLRDAWGDNLFPLQLHLNSEVSFLFSLGYAWMLTDFQVSVLQENRYPNSHGYYLPEGHLCGYDIRRTNENFNYSDKLHN